MDPVQFLTEHPAVPSPFLLHEPSLAGLITSSLHQRWIEDFLAEAATA